VEGGRSRKARRRGGVILPGKNPVKGDLPIFPIVPDLPIKTKKNPQNKVISSSLKKPTDPNLDLSGTDYLEFPRSQGKALFDTLPSRSASEMGTGSERTRELPVPFPRQGGRLKGDRLRSQSLVGWVVTQLWGIAIRVASDFAGTTAGASPW
jgi:hypothetical protein